MFLTVARLLAALVLAGFGVVVGQLPAHACSCVQAGTQAHTKAAADVFTGTVLEATGGERGTGRVTYDVEVDRVYKGDIATATVQVQTGAQSSACGLPNLRADRPYLFFARGADHNLSSCGGTARASDQLVAKVERLLGDGHDPVPTEPEAAVFTQVGDTEPERLTRLAAPGVALVLAGLLGLFVVRRLGSRG